MKRLLIFAVVGGALTCFFQNCAEFKSQSTDSGVMTSSPPDPNGSGTASDLDDPSTPIKKAVNPDTNEVFDTSTISSITWAQLGFRTPSKVLGTFHPADSSYEVIGDECNTIYKLTPTQVHRILRLLAYLTTDEGREAAALSCSNQNSDGGEKPIIADAPQDRLEVSYTSFGNCHPVDPILEKGMISEPPICDNIEESFSLDGCGTDVIQDFIKFTEDASIEKIVYCKSAQPN